MKEEDLMKIVEDRIKTCTACKLSQSRTRAVPGEGNISSPLLFVGEGPGEEEDNSGRPFVGRAGQLFDKILEAANFTRSDLYITNIVKCRPPSNRVPESEEINTCSHFLIAQISIIKPKIIVPLGATALKFFLGDVLSDKDSITTVRGKIFEWKGGIKIFPMFHPSYLLRQPSKEPGMPKALTWEDIKTLKKMYDGFVEEGDKK
jgi:uracil-DNA glycosylase family 4|uniref:Type-4 uracil-DNA glycosylase n=1 Tax=Mesoaciditoga lauensis TaxID=1495039 RepID=A0A7V3VT11_9BACT